MCGIVGFNWNDKGLIKDMIKEITHRGPDDSGFYTDKKFSLGFRRLSIVDLSKKANQPMYNEDKTIVLVFNGEIYNFKILRKELEREGHNFISDSDTEVIIHGYEQYGERIFSLLDGMFALAILDLKNRKLLLARDRIGIKPLYYYHKEKFIFASEIKSILIDKEVKREINFQCLSDYLTLRYSTGDKTMFNGIKKLEPGKYLVYKNSKIELKDYWKFPKLANKSNPSTKVLDKLIESSIKKRLMADVPIGVFLSGGLDSSTMVAYLSRFNKNIQTFSVGFGDITDETKYARRIADTFNTDHTEMILDKEILSILPKVVWHLDEPMADPANLPTYLLSEKVSQKVKVALSGEGGDEVFGGYHTFNYIKKFLLARKIPGFLRDQVIGNSCLLFSNFFKYPKKQMLKLSSELLKEKNLKKSYKKLFYFPFDEKDKAKIFPKNSSEKIDLSTSFDSYMNESKDLKNNVFLYYFKDWLPNDLLIKADKMGMANSLEIRVPFLDTNLIKYFFGLDNKYKQDRYLFRKTVGKLLPKSILKKKKQGFTLPLSNWVHKKEFLSRLNPHFNDLSKRKIFNEVSYKKIIKNPSHFKNDHKMWVLLNFELWCKIYLDKLNYSKIII
jgi:asparagine synthase (glutamine-hydrolysing)